MGRRPQQHEAETTARKAVANALPSAWEHRETTGRDYGVDMQVELFEGGDPTGRVLLLQIKAISNIASGDGDQWLVDVDAALLRYAELFAAPLLLAVVHPVRADAGFRYLWLQEYIRVVLDGEKPDWRAHKATARLRIPQTNAMPGDDERLAWIAGAPQRLRGAVGAARVQHEVQKRAAEQIDSIEIAGRIDASELDRVLSLLQEARGDRGFLGDPGWSWARQRAGSALDPAIAACLELRQRLELPAIMPEAAVPVECTIDDRGDRAAAVEALQLAVRAGELVSAALSIFDDARLAYDVWTILGEGSH